MSERTRNILVGFTALLGLVGLAFLLMLFGYIPSFLERGYVVRVDFPAAAGLSQSSRVRLSGVDIGHVTAVELLPHPRRGVRVAAFIRPEHRIPLDCAITVESKLFGGSPVLAFEPRPLPPDAAPATSPADSFVPVDGSALLQGQVSSMWADAAAELKKSLDDPAGPLSGFKRDLREFKEQFATLSRTWIQVGDNVNRMIAKPAGAPEDYGNIPTLVASIGTSIEQMGQTLEQINQLLGDEQFGQDLRATVSNARQASEKINQSVERITQRVDAAQADLNLLTRRYVALADDLAAATASLRQTLDQARDGRGTVGKLLQDPALYNNLNDTVERAGKTLDEVRLLIEKWKAEGVPVQF